MTILTKPDLSNNTYKTRSGLDAISLYIILTVKRLPKTDLPDLTDDPVFHLKHHEQELIQNNDALLHFVLI